MRPTQAVKSKFVNETYVCRRSEGGFTLLEMTFTLLLLPLFIGLLVHFLALGEAFYEQPRGQVNTTPQLIVRKLFDSRDCQVREGRLVGTYVRPDETTWTWTLKQINRNLVMVGEEGGNLLFIRGIDGYRVEPLGNGYRIQWTDSIGPREKSVMCMRSGSSSSLR
ncbi:hypothetical protein [Exiguobacterium sp. SH1S21]|uniref:hypothetical protein n=1 Tax=Exiguobacterium sp. SH1S21 TaxID=2510953 RepID=UPI0013761C56|nr:hypothetical protein [Exiguobacterium sp. SH1S21]